jgi:hypothetical protein
MHLFMGKRKHTQNKSSHIPGKFRAKLGIISGFFRFFPGFFREFPGFFSELFLGCFREFPVFFWACKKESKDCPKISSTSSWANANTYNTSPIKLLAKLRNAFHACRLIRCFFAWVNSSTLRPAPCDPAHAMVPLAYAPMRVSFARCYRQILINCTMNAAIHACCKMS